MNKRLFNIAVIVADKFEDIELFAPIDIWKGCGANIILYSLDNLPFVVSNYGIKISVQNPINEINLSKIDAIFIPGGPAVSTILKYDDVLEIVKEMNKKNKNLFAICAGPVVLEEAGILEKRKVTVYPTLEKKIKTGKLINKDVVIDKNIITARGPGIAIEFAFECSKLFASEKLIKSVKKRMLIK